MITTTCTILLEGLADPTNKTVWREFDARYRPVITGFARRLGLDEEDATEVAQEVLVQFVRDYREGKYERSEGRLRSWIFGITRNRVIDLKRVEARRKERRGNSALGDLADSKADLTEVWEAEWRQALLRQGIRELREESKLQPRTLQVFEMLVFGDLVAADVATAFEMTIDQVYVAKSRVLSRLQVIVRKLEEIW